MGHPAAGLNLFAARPAAAQDGGPPGGIFLPASKG